MTEEGLYARAIGIPTRRLAALGGSAKLKALDADTRRVLLGEHVYARYLIHPQAPANLPLEVFLTDDELDATAVEGTEDDA